MKRSFHLSALVSLVLHCVPVHAQSNAQSDTLFKTIQSLDTQMFDAYNHCDLPTLGAMVSDDLEFYHDQTGLSVGRAPLLRRSSRTSAARWSGRLWRAAWRVIR